MDMHACWKCSTESDEARCGACGALNACGDMRINGVLKADDEVTIYAVEDSPGHLVVDLTRKGILSQLPRPDKKGALDSKAFTNIWKRCVGDHPLLQEAAPQRFEVMGERIDKENDHRVLFVEVHGLASQPTPKTTNGVQHSPEAKAEAEQVAAEDAAENADVDAPPPEPITRPTAEAVQEAEPMAADAADTDEPDEAPVGTAPLPGLELAVLPAGNALSNQIRLDALRDVLVNLRESERHDEALEKLKLEMALPDSTRRLAENLFLHLTYGRTAMTVGDEDEARSALTRAFKLDPRDREVLQSYAIVVDRDSDADVALQVERNLLLHHRRSLDSKALAGVYKRLGKLHDSRGELDRARICFEQALDTRSDDREALDLLLAAVEQQGDPEMVIKVRQRLLEQMRDPKGRAMLRISIGDDYRTRLGDNDRAMEQYELAAGEHPNSTSLKRLARTSMEVGQWRRAVDAFMRMSEVLTSDEDKAEAMVQTAAIHHHHLGSWERAAECYERALELHPTKLDILSELVSLLVSGERWTELQGVYERAIDRAEKLDDPSPELLGVLWKKLGELQRLHLNDDVAAAKAYARASEANPNDLSLHELLAGLLDGEEDKDSRTRAIHHNRQILALSGETRLDAVERLGMAHLHLGELDQALCSFRVLTYNGQGSDQIKGFVESNTANIGKIPNKTISPVFYKQHLLDKGYDTNLGEVFDLTFDALMPLLDHDPEYYGLSNKDRIDRKEGLMFTKLYRDIARALGFAKPPTLFYKKGNKGMFNGALHPTGFVVGDDLLGEYSEKEISFTVAKQLAFSRQESFLFQIRSLNDMGIFFHIVLKALNPNHKIQLNKDMERLAGAVRKLKPEKLKRLGHVLQQLAQLGQINLGSHQIAFEDAANRCGMLFCDDLNIARDMLGRESKPVGDRSVEERMAPLISWTLSPAYQVLRKDLGLAIG